MSDMSDCRWVSDLGTDDSMLTYSSLLLMIRWRIPKFLGTVLPAPPSASLRAYFDRLTEAGMLPLPLKREPVSYG